MNDADRRLVAEIAERDGTPPICPAAADRRDLLRIVREQEALLRERDTQAEDRAEDAAEREFLRPIGGGG